MGYLLGVIFFCCAITFIALLRSCLDHARAQNLEPMRSKVHAINDMLTLRKYHLEKIEAHMEELYGMRQEWCDLHSEEIDSCQGDELTTFWISVGESYEDTLNRCNRLRGAK